FATHRYWLSTDLDRRVRTPPPTRRSSDLVRHPAVVAIVLQLFENVVRRIAAVQARHQVQQRHHDEDHDRAEPQPHAPPGGLTQRSEEHTSELPSREHLVCRLLLEKKKKQP